MTRFETSFAFSSDHRSTYSSFVDTRSKRSVRMAMMHVTRLSLYSFFFPLPPSSFSRWRKRNVTRALLSIKFATVFVPIQSNWRARKRGKFHVRASIEEFYPFSFISFFLSPRIFSIILIVSIIFYQSTSFFDDFIRVVVYRGSLLVLFFLFFLFNFLYFNTFFGFTLHLRHL